MLVVGYEMQLEKRVQFHYHLLHHLYFVFQGKIAMNNFFVVFYFCKFLPLFLGLPEWCKICNLREGIAPSFASSLVGLRGEHVVVAVVVGFYYF